MGVLVFFLLLALAGLALSRGRVHRQTRLVFPVKSDLVVKAASTIEGGRS